MALSSLGSRQNTLSLQDIAEFSLKPSYSYYLIMALSAAWASFILSLVFSLLLLQTLW